MAALGLAIADPAVKPAVSPAVLPNNVVPAPKTNPSRVG